MKKHLLCIGILFCSFFVNSLYAQEVIDAAKDVSTKISSAPATPKDSISGWKFSGFATLNFGQVALVNWASGGENTISVNALINTSLNYSKNKWAWDNSLDLQYGTTYSSTNDWQKNLDKISLSSQSGYQINTKWYYAFLGDFNSQFDKGYDYANNPDHYISKFMAPAYTNFALGIAYKPKKNYSFFLSPITIRTTFVLDDSLATTGAFGMEDGDNYKMEPGAYFVAKISQNLVENVDLITKFDLFTPYNSESGRLDANWEILLNCKINKFLTTTLNTTFRYYKNESKRLQIKEIFSLGFSYKF